MVKYKNNISVSFAFTQCLVKPVADGVQKKTKIENRSLFHSRSASREITYFVADLIYLTVSDNQDPDVELD